MTPDDLLNAYRETAAARVRAMEEGDDRRARAAYDLLTSIRALLREAGPEHARAILTLLDDTDPAVRCAAAVDALELAPEDGVRVLRDIVAGPSGVVRRDAEVVLREWQAGR